MRVLTSPADTGAVALSMPQDVQAEAFDFPSELFEKRVWAVQRPRSDAEAVRRAAALIRGAKQPLTGVGFATGFIFAHAQGRPPAECLR